MSRIGRSRRRDSGFTLIELLIVVTILGILAVPVGNFVADYFRNTAQNNGTLSESHDAQIASAFWQQDVGSIGVRNTSYDKPTHTFLLIQSVNNPTYGCTDGSSTPIIVMAWDSLDTSGNTTQVRVAYVQRTQSGETQLVRLQCSGSSSPVASSVLAHNLVAGSASATCRTLSSGGSISCTSGVPPEIDLTFTVSVPPSTPNYVVTLKGQRRQT